MAKKKYIDANAFNKLLADELRNFSSVDTVEVFDHTATEMAYRNGFEAGKKEAIKEIEASGEWVHLPCKVGDTVYIIKYYCDYNACSVQERASCCGCRGYRDNKYIVCSKTFDLSDAKQIGKTVFLTREEAQYALEMKGEKE